MKKYLLGSSALVLAIGFSSFTALQTNTKYQYNGAQTAAERVKAANYTKNNSLTCSGSSNECGVILNQDSGTNPNFTGVTFDPTTGFPTVSGHVVSNIEKD